MHTSIFARPSALLKEEVIEVNLRVDLNRALTTLGGDNRIPLFLGHAARKGGDVNAAFVVAGVVALDGDPAGQVGPFVVNGGATLRGKKTQIKCAFELSGLGFNGIRAKILAAAAEGVTDLQLVVKLVPEPMTPGSFGEPLGPNGEMRVEGNLNAFLPLVFRGKVASLRMVRPGDPGFVTLRGSRAGKPAPLQVPAAHKATPVNTPKPAPQQVTGLANIDSLI